MMQSPHAGLLFRILNRNPSPLGKAYCLFKITNVMKEILISIIQYKNHENVKVSNPCSCRDSSNADLHSRVPQSVRVPHHTTPLCNSMHVAASSDEPGTFPCKRQHKHSLPTAAHFSCSAPKFNPMPTSLTPTPSPPPSQTHKPLPPNRAVLVDEHHFSNKSTALIRYLL